MSNIELTHALLSTMAERICAAVPTDGLVFFGLRGALPLDLGGTDFAPSRTIRLVDYNHQLMRCTIGQWRPADRTVAVFPGSTVPNLQAISKARAAGGAGANMLMLGRYRYQRGIHKAATPRGHRAFRQAMFFPVWRSADDLDYDLNDRLDLGQSNESFVFDNLHCAFHDNVDTPGYSSNGCQVVAGLPMAPYRGNNPETGPWRRFVENAYNNGNGQTEFVYLLFSGAEAAMVASNPAEGLPRSLRFGSSGDQVREVQTALKSKGYDFLGVDGDFGRDTLQAVMAFQRSALGSSTADGVVGANTAAALGLAWPRIRSIVAAVEAPPAAVPAAPVAHTTFTLPKDWQDAATRITPGFEVSGDPYMGATGDFDGMGISCGALQWNIGKGSLQPMVKKIGKDIVRANMPQFGNEMWQACIGTISDGLRIVRGWQTGTKLSVKARDELRSLMGCPEMRAEQDRMIETVAQRALRQAATWSSARGRSEPNKREFLWFFDLATQNGSLEGIKVADVEAFLDNGANADDIVCDWLGGLSGPSGHIKDANKNGALWRGHAVGDKLELLVLSYLRSGSANPKWRHVVLNRKGTIAMGKGWVNGSQRDFSEYGI